MWWNFSAVGFWLCSNHALLVHGFILLSFGPGSAENSRASLNVPMDGNTVLKRTLSPVVEDVSEASSPGASVSGDRRFSPSPPLEEKKEGKETQEEKGEKAKEDRAEHRRKSGMPNVAEEEEGDNEEEEEEQKEEKQQGEEVKEVVQSDEQKQLEQGAKPTAVEAAEQVKQQQQQQQAQSSATSLSLPVASASTESISALSTVLNPQYQSQPQLEPVQSERKQSDSSQSQSISTVPQDILLAQLRSLGDIDQSEIEPVCRQVIDAMIDNVVESSASSPPLDSSISPLSGIATPPSQAESSKISIGSFSSERGSRPGIPPALLLSELEGDLKEVDQATSEVAEQASSGTWRCIVSILL